MYIWYTGTCRASQCNANSLHLFRANIVRGNNEALWVLNKKLLYRTHFTRKLLN